jgi:site-specific DNA-methyltransferase (adenine-specific)
MEFPWLMHGDCLEKMKEIPDGSIDMILADLPYGTTACKWDVIIPFEPLWEQYWRVLKLNGICGLFSSEPFGCQLKKSQISYFKYDWIWQKNRPSNINCGSLQLMKYHETISIFFRKSGIYNKQLIERTDTGKRRNQYAKEKNEIKYIPLGDLNSSKATVKYERYKQDINFKNPSSILFFARENKTRHPTQKPVALLEYLIKTYTNENEVVLDNVMGSGSTGVACINTNRKFIGIEKDEKYFEIARERISGTPIPLNKSI